MTTQSTLSTSMARQFAVASLAACLAWPTANAQTVQPGMDSMKPGMAASAPTGSGNMDMKGMKNMMGSIPMSGNTDVDFADMMRVHHQGAI